MSPATRNNAPRPRQLAYLKALAEQTGTSFTYPKTGKAASREIRRLLALKAAAPVALPAEEHAGETVLTREPEPEPVMTYATAVADGEIVGFGSDASWRKQQPVGGATPARTRESRRAPAPGVGECTELARYSVAEGERVLYGQRINGSVRITDRPGDGRGRSFLVERGLEKDGYDALKALVADYTAQATALDVVPMLSSTVRRSLQTAVA